MHIAAARPRYLSRDEVPPEAVETERRVAEQTAKEEGKPEQAITKIVEGRVNAYYKDFVLLEQPSITEPKRTVKQIVDEAGLTVEDRKSTRLNSSHANISYAVFCLKKK